MARVQEIKKRRAVSTYKKPRMAEVRPSQIEGLEDAFQTLFSALASVERSVLQGVNSVIAKTPSAEGRIDFYDEVRRFETALIKQALRSTGGHQRRAAALLGLHPNTLNTKIKAYNINSVYPYLADSRNFGRRADG